MDTLSQPWPGQAWLSRSPTRCPCFKRLNTLTYDGWDESHAGIRWVQWHGFIKDYDGGTLMECHIHPHLPFTGFPGTLRGHALLQLSLPCCGRGLGAEARASGHLLTSGHTEHTARAVHAERVALRCALLQP